MDLESRIIPARAGFTRCGHSGDRVCGDHPRSRGVYVGSHTASNMINGSSPLARGLPPRVGPRPDPQGIIPARAGFTHTAVRPRPTRRGSSPLARGLRDDGRDDRPLQWIIPARAGFTCR